MKLWAASLQDPAPSGMFLKRLGSSVLARSFLPGPVPHPRTYYPNKQCTSTPSSSPRSHLFNPITDLMEGLFSYCPTVMIRVLTSALQIHLGCIDSMERQTQINPTVPTPTAHPPPGEKDESASLALRTSGDGRSQKKNGVIY
ncbi:hypothetical protein EYF80_053080 [Liparis tanakae]|uniref:Uncharacterized protein n=1 Tax=Liparis tanakae TaxID=230148 RepID=A0A4Z2F6L9_9TELE|nr:hypothetical protein EYF80_053080 [Liparis tanakae]